MNNKDKSAYQGGKKKSSRSDNTNNWTAFDACGQKLSSELSSYYCLKNNCLVLDSGQIKFDF